MVEVNKEILSDRGLVFMEAAILNIKKKSNNEEWFLKQCNLILNITYPEVFLKAYWERDFEKEFIKKSIVIAKKPSDVYNYLVDLIDLEMSEKDFLNMVNR